MQTQQTRRTRIGKHLRRHVVAYVALMLAVSMSPLPSWAHGKIATKDIKNGAVTAKKIKAGAVKTKKIKAGAITAGTLGTLVEHRSETPIADGAGASGSASCEEGERLISGGTSTLGVGISAGWTLIRSGPNGDDGWSAAVRNETGDPGTLIVYALCLAP